MTLKDCRNVPVSSDSQALIDTLDKLQSDNFSFRGNPLEGVNQLLRDHPDFLMGHIFKANLLTQALETRVYDEMKASVEAAKALSSQANEREKGHIAALEYWLEGDFFNAVRKWEEVSIKFPLDLFALQLVHLTGVLVGDIANQRDSVSRVFPYWDESIPGYEHVLGFYSFGLMENNNFKYAEELGRKAVSILPSNPYAIHAVAHVMEMEGRQAGGINWMESRLQDWESTSFSIHLWWHLSLYYLDLGNYAKVLDLYDNKLRTEDTSDKKYEELDACALLWRLKLLGIDVGDRWSNLADKWEPSVSDTLYAFNDVHAMMAFVADDRKTSVEALITANERYLVDAKDSNAEMSRVVGMPFCRALMAYHQGNYDFCVDTLLPVRYKTSRLGGSSAQRDIIDLTLIEAALKAKKYDLAACLTNERCALKPTSPQNWKLASRAYTGLGNLKMANIASYKSESIL